ncbi:hypothetical protein [Aquimarina algiphila]|uniref:hypothetical protein n=1 Tax=Aquimarina algiphila TaxID=2047982 RepID=UPI00249066AD|nr:hypothetical protein [Aquimarina algiphila]
MDFDSRDVIWEKIFEVYYDSYWMEIVSDNVIRFWQKTDDITKVLVALTASGSAVSGWTLWNQQGVKYIWAILAGISAVLSITHAALGVAGKVRDWTEIKRQFTTLRIELESTRDLMEINPDFSIEDFENHYKKYKKRYGELFSSVQNDIILSQERKVKCQDELNIRLGLV